ncbi:GGDEF domain-containing protein [Winogradskya humida]|uniref:GGDEF domain-containing protein n=1 Tax=Winogradskya humida TaxID=113566 RepID=UPI0019443E2F|nr:GGDEF domain-containing protein [Actinoplanes humidus]
MTFSRPPAVFAYYALTGIVIMAAHRAATLLGCPELVRNLIYNTGTLAAAVAVFAGVRINRPAYRLPWLLIGAGAAASALGDFLYYVYPLLGGVLANPHVADIPFLSRFPLIAAGLVLLIRRRTPGWDGPAAIDAGIVTVAACLVSWVFVINPVTVAAAGPLVALTSAAYPVGDLLLIVVGARLLLGAGAGLTAMRLLGGYLVVYFVSDAVYTVQAIDGTYAFGGWLDMIWIGGSTLLGLAALHPSMALLGERTRTSEPTASRRRLMLLALAPLLAPATLAVQTLRGANMHPLVVAVGCTALFLLVVARLAGLVEAQRRTAITDALTGLHTRRYFEEALGAECARAARTQDPLSLVLLDVDHFKRVNDTYGHSAGDRVLCQVAMRLRSVVRAGDVVARYGGEEFAVLLPRTGPQDAYVVAERLREVIAAAVMELGTAAVPVTVSVGVAAIPVHAPSAEDLVLATDRLLYDSKETGRNRVSMPAQA